MSVEITWVIAVARKNIAVPCRVSIETDSADVYSTSLIDVQTEGNKLLTTHWVAK